MYFECQMSDSSLECCFPADPACIEMLLERISIFLAGKCDEKIFFSITLVLRESLNNAVFHGAGEDRNLCVGCNARLDKNMAIFEVSSPGPGFNWREKIDNNPSGSTSQRGWGMFLITQYSDGFEFNESGNKLKFWIRLSDMKNPTSQEQK